MLCGDSESDRVYSELPRFLLFPFRKMSMESCLVRPHTIPCFHTGVIDTFFAVFLISKDHFPSIDFFEEKAHNICNKSRKQQKRVCSPKEMGKFMKEIEEKIRKDRRKKWKWKAAVPLVLILAVFIWLMTMFFPGRKITNRKYSEFYCQVENREVVWAEISDKYVEFMVKGDEKLYRTENPQKNDFREFLLLHDVEVETETSISEWIYILSDMLFNVFFFGLIGFLIYKLSRNRIFRVVKHVNAGFDDVVGMEGLKKEFYQIMNIMKNPEEYRRQGIRMPKGILLEGDPGNGKTLFARAAAGESSVSFIPAKATDFESMFMAVGPMKVKQLFKLARRHAPCIVFIDEFDGIGTRRSYSHTAMETENIRIVTALLNELDGFTENDGILVLAATNNRKALDEALIRPGRFDRKYLVPYPDRNDRIELIKMYTADKKLAEDVEPEELAGLFDKCSCAKIETILNQAALIAERRKSEEIGRVEIMMAVAQVND